MNGDILIETVGKIEQLVTDAQRGKVIPVQGMPGDRYLFEREPGDVEVRDVPRKAVTDQAASIEGLCQQINKVGGEVGVYVGDKIRVVWDEDRRDSIEMPLKFSDPFKILHAGEMEGLKQRDLIWLLRTTFAGTFSSPALLPTLRNLKFSAASDGDSTINHGRESMGKRVSAEITGAGEIPEDIIFNVPVYSDVQADENQYVARVVCAIDIDLDEQRFTIEPLPDEVARARRKALQWICAEIRKRCPSASVFECSQAG